MNICHITSVHRNDDVRIFRKECISLAKAGYEVYLVAPGESREENGVHVIGIGDRPTSRMKRMTSFARKAYDAALALNCEVYHIHDPELLPYALKLKRQGKKVIFDSHEFVPGQILGKTYLPRMIRSPMSLIVRTYQRYVMRRIDATIYVSPHYKGEIEPYCARSCMVTNYPVLESVPDGVRREDRTICFAGGIAPQWNHETVLRALERLTDVRYRCCGHGATSYLERLRAYPAWGQVEYEGEIDHRECMKLLRSGIAGMALCAYSANSAGKVGTLGNTKLFEAMAVALPVICTGFILWREIIEKYRCGICVDPADVDAVADAITYLLAHPAEAELMGENGRRAVMEEFNWGAEEKKLLALYNQLTEK